MSKQAATAEPFPTATLNTYLAGVTFERAHGIAQPCSASGARRATVCGSPQLVGRGFPSSRSSSCGPSASGPRRKCSWKSARQSRRIARCRFGRADVCGGVGASEGHGNRLTPAGPEGEPQPAAHARGHACGQDGAPAPPRAAGEDWLPRGPCLPDRCRSSAGTTRRRARFPDALRDAREQPWQRCQPAQLRLAFPASRQVGLQLPPFRGVRRTKDVDAH